MEKSDNKEPLKELPDHHKSVTNQHTESNNKDTNILITKIINQLEEIYKNQTNNDEDEGDYDEDEGEDEGDYEDDEGDYDEDEGDYEDDEGDYEDDEGDYDEDEGEGANIKWKSLEKLLESHINITNVFIELAKRG